MQNAKKFYEKSIDLLKSPETKENEYLEWRKVASDSHGKRTLAWEMFDYIEWVERKFIDIVPSGFYK